MTLAELESFIREIQTILESPAEPAHEELIDLALRHEQFVSTAHDRLEKVELLLSKGLRSEALELAERDPDLNDVLATLDFPELATWNELLRRSQIQTVPTILLESAAELNDAYLATASLKKLLQQFRTVNLARAPLAERIAVLRRLASRDPQNPTWPKDLHRFERQRLKELGTDFQQAVREQDLSKLAQLDREVNADGWSVTVPDTVRRQVRQAHADLRRKEARRELEQLSHQLSDAYAEFNHALATRLQQRFAAVQSIAAILPDDPLMDIAGPALDWLNEQAQKLRNEQEHRQAVTELEQTLDRETTIDELERLYHRATRHGDAVPRQLEQRIASRRDHLAGLTRRRRHLTIAAVTATCVVAAVGIVLLVRSMQFSNVVQGHDQRLAELLTVAQQSGQVSAVQDYLDQLEQIDPLILQTPQLLARSNQLASLLQREKGRLSQRDQLLRRFDSELSNAVLPSDLRQASDTLQELNALLKGEQDRTLLLQSEQRLFDIRTSLQQRIDNQYSAELQQLVADVDALPDDSVSPHDALIARLNVLNSTPEVSLPLQQSVTALLTRLVNDRKLVSENLEMAASLQNITSASGRESQYTDALADYLRSNPGTGRSADFEAVLNEESAIWKQANEWNAFCQRLVALDLTTVSPAAAAQLVMDAESLAMKSAPFAQQLLDAPVIAALRAVADRVTPEFPTPQDRIRSIFSRPTITDAYLIQTIDGVSYYSGLAPVNNGDKNVTLTFNYFTTTSGTQTKPETLRFDEVQNAVGRTGDDWLAPQTRLYNRIEAFLKDRSTINKPFETLVTELVLQVVAANDVDPVLRTLLIDELLRFGENGSAGLRLAAAEIREQLSTLGISSLTNWAAPADPRAEEARKDAKRFLDASMIRIRDQLQQALPLTQTLSSVENLAELRWVGWTHKNARAEWIVSFRPDLQLTTNSGPLVVFHHETTAAAPVVMATVGSFTEQSALSQSANPVTALPREGRPVYLLLPRSSSGTLPPQ